MSVVVANPGAMRWMRPAASALAGAGLLRAYITTVIEDHPLWQLAVRVPGMQPLARELSLRPVPPGIPRSAAVQASVAAELLRVATLRSPAPPRLTDRVTVMAAHSFDRAVAARLKPHDRAVLGMVLNSRRAFRRAHELGAAAVLDYPIAHHRFAEQLLGEEQRLRPDWARTLQFHATPADVAARLDDELGQADRIIVLTSFQRRTFVEQGIDEHKLVQIPLGVELEQFTPRPAERHDDRFRILFVGQVTQRKGVSYLVDAFARAGIRYAELTLLGRVVGAAPWRSRPGIVHIPAVRFDELPRYYWDADVYVLPSLIEGFPQTALQAMAAGLPVIVSENTFGEDVIDDGVDGFIVPIRDADAIADRLRTLHADPDLRARMGAAARRRAEEFTWTRYGERVTEEIRQLTGISSAATTG